MINSDCIYFSTLKTEDLSNVDLNSKKFGKWNCAIKDVSKILAFQALSPFNLNITYESCNGEVKNLAKICGFQMQNLLNEECVNQEIFENFILEALVDNKVSKTLKRVHSKMDKNSQHVKNEILNCQLKNKLFKKHCIVSPSKSLPYGFTKDMQDALNAE